MTLKRHLLALAATALIAAGCATVGGPARNDEIFSRIHTGMTRDDVRRIAGPPDEEMPFPMSHTTSWGYYYFETFGYYAVFSATFGPDGRVVSTFVRRLNDGGDHGV
jgi:outer membrane protein assembly factor BamE (lipoprotein component of BamABCDE complex)